jgi:hypothetical protein
MTSAMASTATSKRRTKLYGLRVAERFKKAIEVDPTRAVVGLQQDSQRRAERRGATAVFAARWTAAEDE